MKPGGVVNILFALVVGGGAWEFIRLIIAEHRRPKVDGDEAWKKLNAHLDEMHTVLGSSYELSSVLTDKGREIYLVCRTCHRKNRLHRGFSNATCGQCHDVLVPNVKPAPADARTVN